jgi:SAM-dependent methyltransferase
MEKNKIFFKNGEADKWFRRNKKIFQDKKSDETIDLLIDWMKPFENDISNVLEIGCGSGHRINQITKSLSANGFGIEPSAEAVKYIQNTFPTIEAKLGFGDKIPFHQKFDLVHLGFYLYLVDREFYLRCISEADRLVKFDGFLSIIDFETPIPYSNDYSHQKGVFSHKHNNSNVFVASGLYSIVNKFQFSHNNFFFDKSINERLSLTLLYKETQVFGKSRTDKRNK